MLRYIRIMGFGAAFALILTLATLTTPIWAGTDSPPPAPLPSGSAEDVAIVVEEASMPRLYIAGREISIQAGSHLGRPQISPDGQWVAITVVPAGTETANLAQVWVFERATGAQVATLPGILPRWQTDGTLNTYTRERRIVFAPDTGQMLEEIGVAGQVEDWLFPQETIPPRAPVNPTYPLTIRVKHHPENNCRDVPDGQVDTIPFEEYVARVVSAEVPSSWHLEALAAQAVAVRTYAWYQILVGRTEYDVTDWANFQMMCDRRYPATDQAAAMTKGQYLSAANDSQMRPIVAMYSAENGHPTLTNPWVPYLQAVPDWAGLGRTRWGHGYGMSQWGAQRRAKVGQTYRQILGHYYTNVHIQDGQEGKKIAGIVGPEPGKAIPPGGLQWKSLAPYGQTHLSLVLDSRIGLTRTMPIGTGQSPTGTEILTGPIVLQSAQGVWLRRPPSISGDVLTATLYIEDAVQETITIPVDLVPPTSPSIVFPTTTNQSYVSITVNIAPNELLGLSNNWTWQGEELFRLPNSFGEVIADPEAYGGAIVQARAGVHSPGVWYGPYTTILPSPARYRAVFRLRIGSIPEGPGTAGKDLLLPNKPVARLDVVDHLGTEILGLRDIWLNDFAAPNAFQEIPVDFYLFEPPEGLEFRVAWHGDVDLALDQVQVWQIWTADTSQSRLWPIGIGLTTTVSAVVFDVADNMSQPITQAIRMIDQSPPEFGHFNGVNTWWNQLPITVSAIVRDAGWGLDTSSGQIWIDDRPIQAQFARPDNPWEEQKLSGVLTDLDEGEHIVRFQARDRGGNQGSSSDLTVGFDRTPPAVQAQVLLTDNTPITSFEGWFGTPVYIQIAGQDTHSGVKGIAYVLDEAPFRMYREPFLLDQEGWHTLRYWAQDWAGNYTASHYLYLGLDLVPPQIRLRGGPLDSERAQIYWEAVDSGSGLSAIEGQVQRDGGPWQALEITDNPLEIPFSDAQVMIVRLRGTDNVGHTSEWVEIELRPATHTLYLPNISQ